jgi:hypothetical protein
MRWTGHMARAGEYSIACRVLWGYLNTERDYAKKLGLEGKILFK